MTDLIPKPDEQCEKFFTYRDFFECSDTWKQVGIVNAPKELATYDAIKELCEKVLDPVSEEFGVVHLTYGFSSSQLVKHVQKKQVP